MYDDVVDNFSKAQNVGAGSRETTAKAKRGEPLEDFEKALMETIRKGQSVQNHIRWILSEHPAVKYYAIEEAMTGNMKFSDVTSRSNWLMVFSPNGQGTHIDKIDSSIITDYVSKTTFSPALSSKIYAGEFVSCNTLSILTVICNSPDSRNS